MFPKNVYERRRAALLAKLGERGIENSLLLFLGNGESPNNYRANAYPFRQDSSWLYFFGIAESSLSATIDVESGEVRIFGHEPSLEDTIWTGPRPSLAETAGLSGVDKVETPEKLADRVKNALKVGVPLRFLPPYRAETELRIGSLLHLPDGKSAVDLADGEFVRAVVALREIKDDLEIAEIESAVGVSSAMHEAVIKSLKPGWKEYEAASLVRGVAESKGFSLSFAPIATTRGEVFHNRPTDSTCGTGSLFLLDAGAEAPSGYAGDLTTVFPVGRAFSPRQREIYSILLEVFRAAVSNLALGAYFKDAHLAACRKLAEGLKGVGILRGGVEDIVDSGAHALFFPHGLGHMIGLDVHDMEALGEDAVGYGDLKRSSQFGLSSLRFAKKLVPGMVHSVEPGIYFIPALIEKWASEKHCAEFIRYDTLNGWMECGGMRVEEDWTMTSSGPRRLGPLMDKSLDAIESVRKAL